MVDVGTIRYGISLTYRCNQACPRCNRFLDKRPWPDSDLSVEDLILGYEAVKRKGIEIEKIRVTGGEPLLHPGFVDCMCLIGETWNRGYGGRTCVFTNGSLPRPKPAGWRYCMGQPGKDKAPQPPMISPADLGMGARCGVKDYCHRQRGCGRLFDAFGFACCIFAGAIGRAVGVDPYGPKPIIGGDERICRHCPFTLGVKGAFKLFGAVKDGTLEYPTPTYQWAIERWESEGPIEFERFQGRI